MRNDKTSVSEIVMYSIVKFLPYFKWVNCVVTSTNKVKKNNINIITWNLDM